ncbi:BnaC02g47260D [Brassica napus]|uniref:BnaC02g47260D protein n=1 Tax=Brassica napus TaxID=3708 RepID=A0A078JSL2_BRANA|nr:BnaC02g47260D [Brassica napus]
MAPEKTSQQPDMETKLESEPKPNQEPEEGDDLDPAKSIKKIRTIVETLHTLFPPQLPNLTKSRSIPPPAPNVPVGTSLNHDESENSVHKLKRNLRLLKPGGLDSEDGKVENNGKGIECLPGIHANEEDLKRLAVFRQLKEKFMDLSNDRKICLLSLAVFPENQEVNRTMLILEKLKVTWGGISEHNKAEASAGAVKEFIRSMTRLPSSSVPEPKVHKAPKKVAAPSHLPEKLMKLDLQCFPDAELPSLLEPGKLRTLEKLYIKGGTKLTGFGKSVPEEPTECSVKVLRLKFPQAKSGVEGAEGSLLSKTGVVG